MTTQDPKPQHTPEPTWTPAPWRLSAVYSPEQGEVIAEGPYIEDAKGRFVAAAMIGAIADGEWEANARRIVACVNACASLSTAALEAGMLDRLVTAAQDALTSLDALPHTTITVSGVSQHLRAALRALEGHDAA